MVERRAGFSTRRVLASDHIPNLNQAKLAKMVNEGRLILDVGVVSPPSLLSEEEIIPAALSIVKGRDIDPTLHEVSVPNDWGKMLNKKNDLFVRTLPSMFTGNPGEQAQKAITILDEDLKGFNIDKDFLRSSKVGEFLFKLGFAVIAHHSININFLLGRYVENKSAEDYKKTIESQMTALKESLANLTADDLGAYIRLKIYLSSLG